MHTNEALFANEAFYLAFNQKDLDAMRAVWSASEGLVCLHPGWPALLGRTAVLESWENILANPQQMSLAMYGAEATALGGVRGTEAVMVTCYERVGGNIMVASNLYIAENGLAKLVHHQSGPCGDPPPPVANTDTSH